jgi:hypothetical protein
VISRCRFPPSYFARSSRCVESCGRALLAESGPRHSTRTVIVQRRLQPGGNSSIVADKTVVGWVAEWLKAPVLKTGRRASVSGVRIPPHPPNSLDFHYVSPLVYPSESEARSVVGSVCKPFANISFAECPGDLKRREPSPQSGAWSCLVSRSSLVEPCFNSLSSRGLARSTALEGRLVWLGTLIGGHSLHYLFCRLLDARIVNFATCVRQCSSDKFLRFNQSLRIGHFFFPFFNSDQVLSSTRSVKSLFQYFCLSFFRLRNASRVGSIARVG